MRATFLVHGTIPSSATLESYLFRSSSANILAPTYAHVHAPVTAHQHPYMYRSLHAIPCHAILFCSSWPWPLPIGRHRGPTRTPAPQRYVPQGTGRWYTPVARGYPYRQAHRARPTQSIRKAAARCSPPRLPPVPRPLRRLLQRSPPGAAGQAGWTAQFRHRVAAWWVTRECLSVARPSPNLFHYSLYSALQAAYFYLCSAARPEQRRPSRGFEWKSPSCSCCSRERATASPPPLSLGICPVP